MNKQQREKLFNLHEEYEYIDDCIDNMVASLIRKRDKLFDLSIQMRVIIEEDKSIKLTIKECENTGSAGGGRSAK